MIKTGFPSRLVCLGFSGCLFLALVSSLSGQTWNVNADGNWNDKANWNPKSAPNARDEVVTLGSVITANRVITLSNPRTLGTLTINDNNNYTISGGGKLRFDVSAGSATINVQNSGAPTISLDIEMKDDLVINHTGSGLFTLSGAISGAQSLTHSGAGTTQFTGAAANTYTGATTVSNGTLLLAKTAGVDAIAGSSITVNTGGTLLLGAANQIANTTAMTLAGGTFSTGLTTGFSETLGALTLSGNSSINLGTTSHLLNFADSSALSGVWSGSLTIYGWAGTLGASGTAGQIFFGSTAAGLTSSQLGQISFSGFGNAAILLGTGELVPVIVPEASTVLAALLILGIFLYRERDFLTKTFAAGRTWAVKP